MIVGTHGRSIFILDHLEPIQEFTVAKAEPVGKLFSVPTALQWKSKDDRNDEFWGHQFFTGENPPTDAVISFYLKSAANDLKLPGAGGTDPTAYRTTLVGLQQPWPIAAAFHLLALVSAAALGLPLFALVWTVGSFGLHMALQGLYRAWLPSAETTAEARGLTRLAACSALRSAFWMVGPVYAVAALGSPGAHAFLAMTAATLAATAGAVGWIRVNGRIARRAA